MHGMPAADNECWQQINWHPWWKMHHQEQGHAYHTTHTSWKYGKDLQFSAQNGSCIKFHQQCDVHNVKFNSKAASSDQSRAKLFPAELPNVIKGGRLPSEASNQCWQDWPLLDADASKVFHFKGGDKGPRVHSIQWMTIPLVDIQTCRVYMYCTYSTHTFLYNIFICF